ncbi:MAG: flavodoxin-dependent (E)-4-hydroxy-3-methylbut-2-enyl-diphosphate synthase [Candidatus Omnitrophota bacterium]
MKVKRRKTDQVTIGGVRIGGTSPISIQSMSKSKTSDVRATTAQIKRLERAGCEIVRVSVKDARDAAAIRPIKKKIGIPIVADIHFDHRLAILAMDAGADKIRINPGNIPTMDRLREVAARARSKGIPIRIGINSGSIPRIGTRAPDMASYALRYARALERTGFHDIVISLKSQNIVETIDAYRKVSRRCDYPLHLGITAAGLPYEGTIRSAIGIGALLADGIGDTIRVSLTGEPEEEIKAARAILGALGLRRFEPEIISCPTCGRCQVDLVPIVSKFKKELDKLVTKRRSCGLWTVDCGLNNLRIAVMGCEVNGPGEASIADIGIAAGKGQGTLFKKGKILRKVKEKDFVGELIKELKQMTVNG